MLRRTLLATAAIFALTSWTEASATLIATDGSFFDVTDPSTATFTFLGGSSDHTDEMGLVANGQLIFSNQTTPIGTVFTTVFNPDVNKLALLDVTSGNTWLSDPGLNADGQPHLASSTDFADFNLGPPPFPVSLAYGWEDLVNGGDKDFNDLVFSLNVSPNLESVPEPMSVAILGAGLITVGLLRRRRFTIDQTAKTRPAG